MKWRWWSGSKASPVPCELVPAALALLFSTTVSYTRCNSCFVTIVEQSKRQCLKSETTCHQVSNKPSWRRYSLARISSERIASSVPSQSWSTKICCSKAIASACKVSWCFRVKTYAYTSNTGKRNHNQRTLRIVWRKSMVTFDMVGSRQFAASRMYPWYAHR